MSDIWRVTNEQGRLVYLRQQQVSIIGENHCRALAEPADRNIGAEHECSKWVLLDTDEVRSWESLRSGQ